MGVMEIVLLIAGGIIFVLSFLIPSGEGKNQTNAAPLAKDEIRELVEHEMDAIKGHMDEVVEEAVTYAMEKTERSLERLSNEKIMAINEYSDTVLGEIHRNHEETMFLYDMLNSKHAKLKNTVSEVNRTVKEAEVTVNSFQRLTPETMETPKAAFVRTAQEQMAKDFQEIAPAAVEPPAEPDLYQEDEDGVGNSNDRILELYSQGKDRVQIARELGLGVGEVKLVIDLFDSQA